MFENILQNNFFLAAVIFVGDFIVVGDKMGVIEKIGIKSTRIRSLQGEEVIMSNQFLTSAQVQNFKKMQKRRALFHFGVLYETPQEKIKRIPKLVKQIIESVENAEFDRAHFYKFSDSSLDFEVVYYVLIPDYKAYMDINEKILLGINEAFAKEKISMAYPTRTICLQGGDKK